MKKFVRCKKEMKQTKLICPNCKKYQHPIIGFFGVLIIILSISAWFNSLQELTNSSSLSNDEKNAISVYKNSMQFKRECHMMK